MRLHAFGITDRGMVRPENQDSIVVRVIPGDMDTNSLFAVVADGVGGGKAGHTASSTAVETILEKYLSSLENGRSCIKTAVEAANSRIMGMSGGNPEYEGMATTCTGMVFQKGEAKICHVGDSRLYRIRNGHICRLTEDHTVAQRLYRQGTISAEEVENHPYGHVLTDALGVRHEPRIDLLQCKVRENDAYLLCSDGLTKYLNEEELRDSLAGESLETVAEKLIALAKERGGDDNISVIIVKIGDDCPGGSTAKITVDFTSPESGWARKNKKQIVVSAVSILALAVLGFIYFYIRYMR